MNLSRLLRYTGLGLLLAVLTVGPFFRGLFFWTELLAAIAAIALGFVLWLIGRRLGDLPLGLPGGAAGWGLLALLAAYLLQFAWAVYPRGNLDWVLRVTAAWMAYVMARQEAGPGLRRWLGWLFVGSATLVATVGFAEYTGYLMQSPEIAAALAGVGLQSRMFTVFQYPNTAAVYFLAAMFALLGLALEGRVRWKMTLAGALMAFMGVAFFFTISRGAILTLPFGLAILLIGLRREDRWPAVLLWLVTGLAVAITMKPLGAAVAARAYIASFQWIGAATVIGLLGGLALSYFVQLRTRLQVMLAALALVLAMGGLLLLRPAGGLLPEQATRLLSINFKTVNVVARLTFSADALMIAADHPMGLGGTGWSRTYRQYQQSNYTANETHNHYAQTAVEAGWVGLAALLAALATALWSSWLNRRNSPLPWALASGAALLAGHSLIDFDLSFGLIWLLLWSLLAAAAEPAPVERFERTRLIAGAGGGIVVAGLAAVLALGSHQTDKALDLNEAGRSDEAKEIAQAAARLDRWDSRPLLVIGDRESLEQAAVLDPQNDYVQFQLAIQRDLAREFTGALDAARTARRLEPLTTIYWTKEASIAGKLMVGALHDGQTEEARRLGAELVAMGEELAERRAVAEAVKVLPAPKLEMEPEFRLRFGQGLYLAGREAEAEAHLVEAAKEGLLGSEAEVWLYALYERRGDAAGMERLAKKPWVRFRGVNPVYKVIREW